MTALMLCKKISVSSCAWLVLNIFAALASAQSKEPNTHSVMPMTQDLRYQRAREAVLAGDFQSALLDYECLVFEQPTNVDYVFGYAQVLFWTGDTIKAIRFLGQAREMTPDYEDVWKFEYSVLLSPESNQSIATIDRFRQMAAKRFPNAIWPTENDNVSKNRHSWSIAATRDYLSNEEPEWEQLSFLVVSALTEQLLVTFSADSSSRFSTTDARYGIGITYGLASNWGISGAVAISSAPNFLPDDEFEFVLRRRFSKGWSARSRWRLRDYENNVVNIFGLSAERYFGNYRIEYSANSARLAGENALVHGLVVNFFSDAGTELSSSIAIGEEIEVVSPGQLLRSDIWSISVAGRHPVSSSLYIGWRLGTHQQGQLYRRNSIGLSISGGF